VVIALFSVWRSLDLFVYVVSGENYLPFLLIFIVGCHWWIQMVSRWLYCAYLDVW